MLKALFIKRDVKWSIVINYNPPADIEDKEITITDIRLQCFRHGTIQLDAIYFSANSQNVLVLDCLYEHSVKDKVDLKLITADYKYIYSRIRHGLSFWWYWYRRRPDSSI